MQNLNQPGIDALTPEEYIAQLRGALIKAAICQVMVRNLSHNIGKHVLNASKRAGHFSFVIYLRSCMKTFLQIDSLKPQIDLLQKTHGHPDYTALYGTGCIKNPRVMFLFMNPTAKNLTVKKEWEGIRAPWVGLKNTWKLMNKLGFIDDATNTMIQGMKPADWTAGFTEKIYARIAKNKAYLTNLARCTQPDARHVPDLVFRASRDVTLREIALLNPRVIIAFGNQVASNLLQTNVRVSDWRGKHSLLPIGKKTYKVFPVFYPVGMGLRNLGKAVEDVLKILG